MKRIFVFFPDLEFWPDSRRCCWNDFCYVKVFFLPLRKMGSCKRLTTNDNISTNGILVIFYGALVNIQTVKLFLCWCQKIRTIYFDNNEYAACSRSFCEPDLTSINVHSYTSTTTHSLTFTTLDIWIGNILLFFVIVRAHESSGNWVLIFVIKG